jgi:hypothetical protein
VFACFSEEFDLVDEPLGERFRRNAFFLDIGG